MILNHCILAVNWFWLSSSVKLFILHVNLQSNFLVIVHNANLHIFGVCWPFGTQVVNSRRHDPPTCEQTSCQNRQACSCLQEIKKKCRLLIPGFFSGLRKTTSFWERTCEVVWNKGYNDSCNKGDNHRKQSVVQIGHSVYPSTNKTQCMRKLNNE